MPSQCIFPTRLPFSKFNAKKITYTQIQGVATSKKKKIGRVGQTKKDVIKQAAFSKRDQMGHRQVGRSKKAKKRGTSLMDVPFPNSSPVEVIASTNILHCLRNSFMFCIYHSHCNSSPECYLTKLVLLVVSFGNYVD